MSSGRHLEGSTPERLKPSRAPLPSLSERSLHVLWATSHVPARSGRCPLVPFGMTGFGQADRRLWVNTGLVRP